MDVLASGAPTKVGGQTGTMVDEMTLDTIAEMAAVDMDLDGIEISMAVLIITDLLVADLPDFIIDKL